MNGMPEICRLLDVAAVGWSFHVLRQRRGGLEDLQAGGAAVVGPFVSWGLQVCCKGLGVRETLAVQVLGRLGRKGTRTLTRILDRGT